MTHQIRYEAFALYGTRLFRFLSSFNIVQLDIVNAFLLRRTYSSSAERRKRDRQADRQPICVKGEMAKEKERERDIQGEKK